MATIKIILKTNRKQRDNSYPVCMGKERTRHRTQKPLKVCIPFIEISSNPGDVILDPFMGAGTTAIAVLKTGRQFIGYEIDKGYCNIIQQRFDDFLKNDMILSGTAPKIVLNESK